jgi:hypothetical protein
MQTQQQAKLFAFKLIEKRQEQESKPAQQWQAREGVAVAGCSGPDAFENYRASSIRGADAGVYC